MNILSDTCIILGAGNSIQTGINLNLFNYLKDQVVFSLNDMFQLYKGTAIIVNDWTFYRDRFEKLKGQSLIIARSDAKYGTEECPILDNTILIPSDAKYYGKTSIENGCYTGVLAGLYTLSLVIGLGFKNIYLLGMDCCETNGKTHVYQGNHNIGILKDEAKIFRTGIGKNSLNRYNTRVFDKSDEELNKLWVPFLQEQDINIYNVSKVSRIDIFKKINYKTFFTHLTHVRFTQNRLQQNIINIIKKKRP